MKHNKQHHREVLLSSFHLNDHIIGLRPQTPALDNHLVQHNKQHHKKLKKETAQSLLFEWSHFRISSTDTKFRSTLYSIVNITGKSCPVGFSWVITELQDSIQTLKPHTASKIAPQEILWMAVFIWVLKIYVNLCSTLERKSQGSLW